MGAGGSVQQQLDEKTVENVSNVVKSGTEQVVLN